MSHTFKPGDVVKRVDDSGYRDQRITDALVEQRGIVMEVIERTVLVMWLPNGEKRYFRHTDLMRATTKRKPPKKPR